MGHCLVYKEGDSQEVRGVKCDFLRIPLGKIDMYEALGYKRSVNDLYKKQEKATELPKSVTKSDLKEAVTEIKRSRRPTVGN